jgi:hypothetical protein
VVPTGTFVSFAILHNRAAAIALRCVWFPPLGPRALEALEDVGTLGVTVTQLHVCPPLF